MASSEALVSYRQRPELPQFTLSVFTRVPHSVPRRICATAHDCYFIAHASLRHSCTGSASAYPQNPVHCGVSNEAASFAVLDWMDVPSLSEPANTRQPANRSHGLALESCPDMVFPKAFLAACCLASEYLRHNVFGRLEVMNDAGRGRQGDFVKCIWRIDTKLDLKYTRFGVEFTCAEDDHLLFRTTILAKETEEIGTHGGCSHVDE
jgi:hypothetical protein